MKLFRNTPKAGALARRAFSALAFASAAMICAPSIAQQMPATPAGGSQLAAYYQQLEQRLISQGHLRQDRRAGGGIDAQTLARNFMAIAMRTEYSLRGNGMSRSGNATPLRRWEQPVRIGVRFGPSVHPTQQRADISAVRGVAQRLQRASGHSVSFTTGTPNFHVLVLSDAERANAAQILRQIAPGLSRAAVNAVTRMSPNTFCMVVAIPSANPANGTAQAIAIVRAEHPRLMRQSCIEEELAQGMGLSNDSPQAWPSIFNDDEEFGVLTRHDELLLRMLYDDSLRCGMSPGLVDQQVEQLAQLVLARG